MSKFSKRGGYSSLAGAKAALKKNGLSGFNHDIIQHPGDADFPKGSFRPVVYADGYEEAEQDRSYVRALGLASQRWPSKDLGHKRVVAFSYRQPAEPAIIPLGAPGHGETKSVVIPADATIIDDISWIP